MNAPTTQVKASDERFGYVGDLVRLKLSIIAAAAMGFVAAYTVLIAPSWLRVTKLRVGIPGAPDQLHGMRIALLSDFHARGEGVSWELLWKARRIALEFEPDLLALTGDYFDDGRFGDSHGLFAGWPAGRPVFGVLGNHDWRSGEENLSRTIAELEAGGVRLLRNEAMAVQVRDTTVFIAGVDDPHLRRDDLNGALSGIPAGKDVLLLLSHSPSIVEQIPPGRIGIVLAGHTHGGQVRLLPSGRIPFIKLVRRLRHLPPRPDPNHFRGNHWVRGTVLIISDGLGLSTIRARFRTRPHVILIELVETPALEAACDNISRYVEDISSELTLLRWLT